jgi:hypothetical protein
MRLGITLQQKRHHLKRSNQGKRFVGGFKPHLRIAGQQTFSSTASPALQKATGLFLLP